MKFDDHISTYWAKSRSKRSFDQAAAEKRIEHLCFVIVTMVSRGLNALSIARKLRKEVKRAVVGIEQAYRYELKLKMLRLPEWRYRVLKDLGGVEKLIRLWKRLSEIKTQPHLKVKRQKKILSYEEIKRREHIQRCAKACAHPNIYCDPFCVDQEGQFRLPPMPSWASQKPTNRVRDYDYDYDGRPVWDFKRLKTPIMVWPEEFMAFLDWEEKPETKEIKEKPRRFPFMDKWMAALLKETADAVPPMPLIKTETARAPPCLQASVKISPPVFAAGG